MNFRMEQTPSYSDTHTDRHIQVKMLLPPVNLFFMQKYMCDLDDINTNRNYSALTNQ